MNIGEKIRFHRNERKLSKTTLAGLCGVSVRSIGRYEAGSAYPPGNVLSRLAAALDVTEYYLKNDDCDDPKADGGEKMQGSDTAARNEKVQEDDTVTLNEEVQGSDTAAQSEEALGSDTAARGEEISYYRKAYMRLNRQYCACYTECDRAVRKAAALEEENRTLAEELKKYAEAFEKIKSRANTKDGWHDTSAEDGGEVEVLGNDGTVFSDNTSGTYNITDESGRTTDTKAQEEAAADTKVHADGASECHEAEEAAAQKTEPAGSEVKLKFFVKFITDYRSRKFLKLPRAEQFYKIKEQMLKNRFDRERQNAVLAAFKSEKVEKAEIYRLVSMNADYETLQYLME